MRNSFEAYQAIYEQSKNNPEQFWDGIAQQFLWNQPWKETVTFDFSKGENQWFIGGKTNITENIFSKIQDKSKIAFYLEPNDVTPEKKVITYGALEKKVNQFANALRKKGIEKGDRVCIYLPMKIEAVIAVLACAKIGAVHTIVFAGFSANALADRINDAAAKCIITAQELIRGEKKVPLKKMVDESIPGTSILFSVVLDLEKNQDASVEEYDFQSFYQNEAEECTTEWMDSEDPLFILYTSGSTGKPKGVVHHCGGYMVYTAYTFKNVFQYQSHDVFWCTADIGWITGHSYLIYGPLLNQATSILFEGIPTYPNPGRFWEIVDKNQVTHFYTAPTAIRSLMTFGDAIPQSFALNSLKVLGTVGEPINKEAYDWYATLIGKQNCPIVDTWWQTETGGILISNMAGIEPSRATYAGLPLPGIFPILLNEKGEEITEPNQEGYLCFNYPWPSMIRTTYGSHERCIQTYFSHFNGYYFSGDAAKKDENGLFRIIGRVDDVINVSGHRFGTAEIENAINKHECVFESAVVGYPHPLKGQGIVAFVIVNDLENQLLTESIRSTVQTEIGAIAKPDLIILTDSLPKTRSGKIMRRILRKIAEGETTHFGDTSTLLEPSIVMQLVKAFQSKHIN